MSKKEAPGCNHADEFFLSFFSTLHYFNQIFFVNLCPPLHYCHRLTSFLFLACVCVIFCNLFLWFVFANTSPHSPYFPLLSITDQQQQQEYPTSAFTFGLTLSFSFSFFFLFLVPFSQPLFQTVPRRRTASTASPVPLPTRTAAFCASTTSTSAMATPTVRGARMRTPCPACSTRV